MSENALMEPVPEDWERALAVVAHPDDLEYGAASAIARWTQQGKHVVYCLVTSGEAGIDSMPPAECGPLREADERASAALVGVHQVDFLGYPDGLLTASIELRRDLAAAIRRHRPDVLIGINYHDRWPGAFNHIDHRVTGVALIDAARDAGNRWLFTDCGDPWKSRFALFNGTPLDTHFVDVSDTIDLGVASLRAHQTYLDALDPGTAGYDPDVFLRETARCAGERCGVEHAVTFELLNL